jgi:CRISPR-associated exonuclease Cas4
MNFLCCLVFNRAFCEPQFSLAYIEMQWSENVLTVEGHHLHDMIINSIPR